MKLRARESIFSLSRLIKSRDESPFVFPLLVHAVPNSKPFFNKDLRHRGVRGVRSARRRRGIRAANRLGIVSATGVNESEERRAF